MRFRLSRLFFLAAPVFAVAFLAACSSGQPPAATAASSSALRPDIRSGGVLRYAIPGDPQSCDLHMTGGMGYQSVHSCNTMLSQLVRFSPADHGIVEPDLATDWSVSSDGLTWTFELREGVTWHDGSSFDADDVVFSFERILDPPTGLAVGRAGPFANYVESGASIESPDESTVTVTTAYPSASFLENVASVYVSIYPRDGTASMNPPTMARFEEVVGTGPFSSRRAVPGSSYEVARNDSYYRPGRPYLDGVEFQVMPDSAVRLAAIQAGQIDVIPIITESEEQALGGSDIVTVHRTPSGGGNTLQLNLRQPPFENAGVRRAVNLAISRDEASLALGAGFIGGVLPPGGKWGMPDSEVLELPGYGDVETNRAEARRLLASAGYTDGFDLEIHTRANFFFELLSDFAAGQLAEIGIRARVVPVEAASYQDMISSGQFAAIGHSHSFPLDDPDAILSAHYGCGGTENYPGLCDQELDSLIEQQSRELDENRRRELLTEIERRAWNADAKIWLQWSSRRTAVNNRVHGLEPGGPSLYQGVRLDTVWLGP